MQSPVLSYQSRTHAPSSLRLQRPVQRFRGYTYPATSHLPQTLHLSCRMSDIVESPALPEPHSSEIHKIQPNSLYLTFNAPQVDEYHRGVFLSTPIFAVPEPRYSGILFHASYTSPSQPDASCPSTPSSATTPNNMNGLGPPTPPNPSELTEKLLAVPTRIPNNHSAPPSPVLPPTWLLDQRTVRDVSTSPTLVLFYRIGTLDPAVAPIEEQVEKIKAVLQSVPLGRENRERELGPLEQGEGNKALEGYDCVIWTRDALSALEAEGVVDLGGRSARDVMRTARAIAGPPDARSMVGVDFGGLRVVN